ncbi:hypothetical protein HG535_0A02600 [Zygotorulaspora mrakii]|uniref:DNA mismatch repair proteins mutS family domain-containing protein n=1 Tax=Zygotorulaspora mrakii TaxID=42260 RepID=A0A7H9AXL2_ZYGMR|nr:uncharacterized protein HG535_0A02600 [Zygotorulaspora mrakii]QLG70322.1 hypothetical protein HG535_0A02600 [Zygotorulaspora mrakii]
MLAAIIKEKNKNIEENDSSTNCIILRCHVCTIMRQLRGLRACWTFVRRNHNLKKSSQVPALTKLRIIFDTTSKDNEADMPTNSAPLDTTQDKILTASGGSGTHGAAKDLLPPTLLYVRDLMDRYENHVVLTQMGSFYELYFEQATTYAPKLNISLTNRTYSCGKVPFAGFPVHQLSRHLKVLVNHYGYSVTIADQFKKNNDADNESFRFFRRVTRIVTPGTFIDEAFENLQENTFLLNLEFPENSMEKPAESNLKIGLCWCDVSTGEIFVQQVILRDLISAVTRIQPREILLDQSLSRYNLEAGSWYSELVELRKYFIKYQKAPSQHRTISSFFGLFAAAGSSEGGIRQLKIQLQHFTQKEITALRRILVYVCDHLPDCTMNFQLPQRRITSSIMQIDSRTSRALELHATVRDNRVRGTLFSTIRRTVTPLGTRLLAQWLSGPSLDLHEIKNRQKLVEFFKNNSDTRESLRSMLKSIHDLPRILQKFSFGRGEASELMQIAGSLKTASIIKKLLKNEAQKSERKTEVLLHSFVTGLEFDGTLILDVLKYLNEDELIKSQKRTDEKMEELPNNSPDSRSVDIFKLVSWSVHPSYSESLQDLHEKYQQVWLEKEKLRLTYQNFFVEKEGAKSLTLKQRQNGEYALYLQGSSNNLKKISEFIRNGFNFEGYPFQILQQATQTRWLSHKLWSNNGYELELALLRIKKEEMHIIDRFKGQFLEKSAEIRKISEILGYIDVLASFGALALEKSLVCPRMDKTNKLEIIGGRHLMVEEGISNRSLEKFIKNDCALEGGKSWIITGPNMGGKSTFLRQNAIIVILAQMGSFIPCLKAQIGLVDKIFTRVGSADDLYNEMSTFMVEMIETSFILRGATDRSLAILDEIGRGTSGKEGVGIAYATLRHLIESNRCRSLFATHYGQELNEIISSKLGEDIKNKIEFFKSTTIETSDSDFCYDYKLKSGICSVSEAIKVAKAAGFPKEALETARALLM